MPRKRLKQRKDGRYAAVYHGRYFYAYTEREALALRDEYIRECERASGENIAYLTFVEYALSWLPRNRRDCGKRTYNDYVSMVKKASKVFGDAPLKSINSSKVKDAYNFVDHLSDSYIKKYCSLIRAILESACDDGAFMRSPAQNVKRPRGTKGTHRALTYDEINMIISAADHHPFGDAAMVMLFAGLRRGEMLALDIDRDVDFVEKKINVREGVWFDGNKPIVGEGKNDFVKREVPLLPPLEKQLKGKHGLILCGKTTKYATETIVQNRFASFIRMMECEENGVRQKRWYSKTKDHKHIIATGQTLPPWHEIDIRMHDFRHTFCVMLFDAGVDMKNAQIWMGHSDPTMIMKIYDHLSKIREEKSQESLKNFVDNFDILSK